MSVHRRAALAAATAIVAAVVFIVLKPASSSTRQTGGDPLLSADRVTTIKADKGDTIHFRVRSSSPTEVHIHGYDIKRDIKANTTTPISFKAKLDGVFEIEFEQTETQIAKLEVEP